MGKRERSQPHYEEKYSLTVYRNKEIISSSRTPEVSPEPEEEPQSALQVQLFDRYKHSHQPNNDQFGKRPSSRNEIKRVLER